MDEREGKHIAVITDLLTYLNSKTDKYILKGETALRICYGLDRSSYDIDLDGKGDKIFSIIDEFCKIRNYSYTILKNTNIVKIFEIHYDENDLLRIEVSGRMSHINYAQLKKINGIIVYDLDSLTSMKCVDYGSKDKITDFYDILFICNNYYDKLSKQSKNQIFYTLSYKGIEQYDYLVHSQPKDGSINNKRLLDMFLMAINRIGMLTDEEDKKNIELYKSECESELISRKF